MNPILSIGILLLGMSGLGVICVLWVMRTKQKQKEYIESIHRNQNWMYAYNIKEEK